MRLTDVGLRAALVELLPQAPAEPIDLRAVQSLLAFVGHDCGPIDGKPGPRTRLAIEAFQRRFQSEPPGEASEPMVAALKAEAIRRIGQDARADTRLAQRLLTGLGFPAGEADGLTGPMTSKAAEAFRRSRSIADGAVGVDQGLIGRLVADS